MKSKKYNRGTWQSQSYTNIAMSSFKHNDIFEFLDLVIPKMKKVNMFIFCSKLQLAHYFDYLNQHKKEMIKMPKKPFKKTAFFKNAKRIIQENKPGAYVLTGYTGSGKTELLKELILVFEDAYRYQPDHLELYLFNGKERTFNMFNQSRFVMKRAIELNDLVKEEETLHSLSYTLKYPSNSYGDHNERRKLIVIDSFTGVSMQSSNNIPQLFWLAENAEKMGFTVIFADQSETLDLFTYPKIITTLRMIDYRMFTVNNLKRFIDVPNVTDDELIQIQKQYREE